MPPLSRHVSLPESNDTARLPPSTGNLGQTNRIRPFRGSSLRPQKDPVLQSALRRIVERLGVERMVSSRRLGIAVADITDPQRPRFAGVNEGQELFAASLPKIGVLVGALCLVDRGQLDLDARLDQQFSTGEREQLVSAVLGSRFERRCFSPLLRGKGCPVPAADDRTGWRVALGGLTLHELLGVMMGYSSNAVPAFLHRHVGKRRLQDILRQCGLFDVDTDTGLWLGKFYGQDPRSERIYHRGGSQNATALQVARFYYLVETGQLFSAELSRVAAQAMSALTVDGRPRMGHKFMRFLGSVVPRPGRVLRKSGTTSFNQTHADSVLVETRDAQGRVRKYIVVMLARGQGAAGLAEKLIEDVHTTMAV
ncbi:serine hydrolase [Myxococcota bacterium]